MVENKEATSVNIENLYTQDIFKYQKNRYPWFFIDFIEKIEPGVRAKGYKLFSYNEFFNSRYWIQNQKIPGFIQGELLEQMFLMTFLTLEKNLVATSTVSSDLKYERELHFGEKLDVEAELKFYKRGLAKGCSVGFVGNEKICEGEFVVSVPHIMNVFRPQQ